MKKIVYIGNNLSKKTKYVATMATLSELLIGEGFQMILSSDKLNKTLRLLDMVRTVLKYRRTADYVLIDTFGAANFYYAVIVAQIARWCKLKYIPILHGGNLPDRFQNNPFFTKLVFKYSFRNVTPSNFLKVELEKVGYKAQVIPNIININDYKFKKRLNYAPKLLYVRAFHQIYNPTMAIKVLQGVKESYPDANLCMIGPPKDASFEETKQLVSELELEDSVELLGYFLRKNGTSFQKTMTYLSIPPLLTIHL